MFFLFNVNLIVFFLHEIQVARRSRASSGVGYVIQRNLIWLAYTDVKGKMYALKSWNRKGLIHTHTPPSRVFHWYVLWVGAVHIYVPLARLVAVKADSKSSVQKGPKSPALALSTPGSLHWGGIWSLQLRATCTYQSQTPLSTLLRQKCAQL